MLGVWKNGVCVYVPSHKRFLVEATEVLLSGKMKEKA